MTDTNINENNFYHNNFKHLLREIAPWVRRRIYERFQRANIPVDGYTDQHKEIINRVMRDKKARRSYEIRYGEWKELK